VGREDLRPRRRSAGGLGAGDHRALRDHGFRPRARRRLRQRPGDRAAARPHPGRGRRRRRCGDGGPRAPTARRESARGAPEPSGSLTHRVVRRDLLVRGVPLDHRSSAPVRAAPRAPEARRPARRAVRRSRQHRARPRGRGGASRHVALRYARGHRAAPARRRVHPDQDLARAEADRPVRHGRVRRDRDPPRHADRGGTPASGEGSSRARLPRLRPTEPRRDRL
ncbi:MAG: hypothetical protein AVDCRST_MAG85-691, partial [uncultured Solirubrobacteraceae bacterium]